MSEEGLLKLWSVPVLRFTSSFSPAFLVGMRHLVVAEAARQKQNPNSHPLPEIEGVPFRPTYNLFAQQWPDGQAGLINEFRQFAKTCYLQYLKEAHQVKNAGELKIMVRAFAQVFTNGERVTSHYHHSCDHVMVLYLACGENRLNTKLKENSRRGDGELLLQDPRHFSSFPFWEKSKIIGTHPGLVVLHPAYVWHESNPMQAEGERVCVVVTFRVASHNYTDLDCEL